jgi:hypothetical protein
LGERRWLGQLQLEDEVSAMPFKFRFLPAFIDIPMQSLFTICFTGLN